MRGLRGGLRPHAAHYGIAGERFSTDFTEIKNPTELQARVLPADFTEIHPHAGARDFARDAVPHKGIKCKRGQCPPCI